jgi:kynureninase
LGGLAGFLVLRSPRAGEICRALHDRGVFADYRADALRLGPAPYLSDEQIERALSALREAAR